MDHAHSNIEETTPSIMLLDGPTLDQLLLGQEHLRDIKTMMDITTYSRKC
jgi:hypothetical protein